MEYVANIIIFVNKGPVKCFVIFPYKLTKFVVGISPVVTAAVLCRVVKNGGKNKEKSESTIKWIRQILK